jgi:hypothetical protein
MTAKTTSSGSTSVGEALSQCQAQLSEAVLASAKNQQAEVVGLVRNRYKTIKQKAQLLFTKGAQTQQKLNHQVREYKTKLAVTGKNLPDQIARTVMRYPWVALAVIVIASAAIGFLVKPSHEAE